MRTFSLKNPSGPGKTRYHAVQRSAAGCSIAASLQGRSPSPALRSIHAPTQRKGVRQFIGFRNNQDRQVMQWLNARGLQGAPFTGLWQRYHLNHQHLNDNDADGIAMLFLTMVDVYREFPHSGIAIAYLFNQVGAWANMPVQPPATVTEFTNRYKTFYHLYSRALLANSLTPLRDAHLGMIGLEQNLGNQAQAPSALPGAPVATDVDRVTRIVHAAGQRSLRFASQGSAVSHLVKHGTMYNRYRKITGTEAAGALGEMIDQYVLDANYAVANGREDAGRRDATLGRFVYTFNTEFERTMISCDANGSNAFIATYFWNEPTDYINDKERANGKNPNVPASMQP